MCPPCLNFFNWPESFLLPALPSRSKKSNLKEVIEKKITLTPLLFCSNLFWTPNSPPGKKMQIGLKPPMCPPCLNFFNWPGSSPLPALPSHSKKNEILMDKQTDRQTDGQKDRRMDGQLDYIMPKIKLTASFNERPALRDNWRFVKSATTVHNVCNKWTKALTITSKLNDLI